MSTPSRIYFHVGLGKVASTYLQYQFFPKLTGIRYIQRTRYKKSPQLIGRSTTQRVLVSREFDRQLEREVTWFSGFFREVRPILLLRAHDSWIASQYRRWVKNGRPHSFDEFFDLEGNTGFWKKKDLLYYPKIKALEKAFAHPPLILFYKDFCDDPWGFFDQLAAYMGAEYSREAISLQPQHRSYSEHELKVLREVSPRFYKTDKSQAHNPATKVLRRYGRFLTVYSVMAAARLGVARAHDQAPLIPAARLSAIHNAYQEDWQACVAYAAKTNPRLMNEVPHKKA